MLASQIIGNANNDQITRKIMDLVADALTNASVQVQVDDYIDSFRMVGVNNGERVFTGKRTLIVTVDGGEPGLKVDYADPAGCCGD